MQEKTFRTNQDIIDFIETKGYCFNRSKGSHKIYSALGKVNIVLVWHNSSKERPHPKSIRDALNKAS